MMILYSRILSWKYSNFERVCSYVSLVCVLRCTANLSDSRLMHEWLVHYADMTKMKLWRTSSYFSTDLSESFFMNSHLCRPYMYVCLKSLHSRELSLPGHEARESAIHDDIVLFRSFSLKHHVIYTTKYTTHSNITTLEQGWFWFPHISCLILLPMNYILSKSDIPQKIWNVKSDIAYTLSLTRL